MLDARKVAWAPVLACACTTYPCQTLCWQGLFISSSGRGRATIPSGGFSARVPPGRRSAFTNPTEAPRRSSFAALISRQPNQRYARVVLQKCPRVSGPGAPAVTTQLSRGSFSCHQQHALSETPRLTPVRRCGSMFSRRLVWAPVLAFPH